MQDFAKLDMARMADGSLGLLFSPRSLAVVGASETNTGGRVIENLHSIRYPGRIYPVNPKYKQVKGMRCYPSVTDLENEVDVAMLTVPRESVPPVLRACEEKNIGFAIVTASGFGEGTVDPLGERLAAEVREIVSRSGMRLCGPNCLGILSMRERVATFTTGETSLNLQNPPGNIGFVSHSGAACIGLLGNKRSLGFSYMISCGNEMNIENTEFMEYLVRDQNTKLIGVYAEGFRNPGRLVRVARLAKEQRKPIIILKSGRSKPGADAIRAHTGILAGSDVVLEAVFRKEGLVRVYTFEELLEALALFSRGRRPHAHGVGFATSSGGLRSVISDLGEEFGINFPSLPPEVTNKIRVMTYPWLNVSNPLDIGLTPSMAVSSLRHMAEVDEIGVLVAPVTNEEAAAEIRQLGESTDKLVVAMLDPFNEMDESSVSKLSQSGVVALRGNYFSLKALAKFLDYERFLDRPRRETTTVPRRAISLGLLLESESHFIDEYTSKLVLEKYGVHVTKEDVAKSLQEAMAIARRIGYPVAAKVISTQLIHKSELGAVKLNISSDEELAKGYREITNRLEVEVPKVVLKGVLIQEMVEGELELLVGLKHDPQFGLVVLFGSGGTMVEVYNDVSLRLLPITRQDAEEMILETKVYKRLSRFKGNSLSLETIVDVIMHVSELALDYGGKIRELDINPLILTDEGRTVKAVDARITTE